MARRIRKRPLTDIEIMKEIARRQQVLKEAVDAQSLLSVASGIMMRHTDEPLPERHLAHNHLMTFIAPYLKQAEAAQERGDPLSVLQTRALAAAEIALESPPRNLIGATKALAGLLRVTRNG
jgi:hypothetical protein